MSFCLKLLRNVYKLEMTQDKINLIKNVEKKINRKRTKNKFS